MIDTTFDRYTAEEIQRRNMLFDRFQTVLAQKQPAHQDELIRRVFDVTHRGQDKQRKYDTKT